MCIIAYKPTNIDFPSDTILKNCYENNPDGAGFMYALHGKVYIKKGYQTWESFKNALEKARKETGDKVPYVMHFRIATQGYEKTMTHPFPLSSNMSNLKRLLYDCNIGVAHNGILDITSDGSKDYSDTMKFITDYLCLIIRSYFWWKDDRTKALIENLIDGSRLAILDKNGHCELMGKGWEEKDGIYYSNGSYSYEKKIYTWPKWNDGYYDDGYYFKPVTIHSSGTTKKSKKKSGRVEVPSFPSYDPFWEKYYDMQNGLYMFTEGNCPATVDGDNTYCNACQNCTCCQYLNPMVTKKNA